MSSSNFDVSAHGDTLAINAKSIISININVTKHLQGEHNP